MASNEKSIADKSVELPFEPTAFRPSEKGGMRIEIGRNGDDFGWLSTDPRESDLYTAQRVAYFIRKLPNMDLSYSKRFVEEAIWYNLTVVGNGVSQTYEFPDTVRSSEARELLRFITVK